MWFLPLNYDFQQTTEYKWSSHVDKERRQIWPNEYKLPPKLMLIRPERIVAESVTLMRSSPPRFDACKALSVDLFSTLLQ